MTSTDFDSLPSDAVLTLRLLGQASLSIVSEERALLVLGPGKPLALLAYLARCPGRTASRDHLLGLLWGDHIPSSGRHALRQTVWYIRQRLGYDSIQVGDGEVCVAANVCCDVDRFIAEVDAGEFENAVELYKGPFLPELSVPGGVEFDRWVDRERVRLRSLFFRSAELVTQRWLSNGRFREAESLARRVRDAAPDREAGWRLLLECLTSANDSVRTTLELEGLKELLAELGKDPEPATAVVIERAKEPSVESVDEYPGEGLVAELVGREREFSAIVRAWDEAKSNTGRHITITAAAGYGKTRLLNDAHARLRAIGACVVHLRANPGERHISYGFAATLANALAALPGSVGISPTCSSALVALNPQLGSRFLTQPHSAAVEDVLRQRTVALSELLDAVAHEQPLAVLLDDLHWMDAQSLALLGGFAATASRLGVLLVTAARPFSRQPLHDTATSELSLPPLSDENIAELISSLGTPNWEGWSSRLGQRLRETTRGSPLLVMETLLLLLEKGWLSLEDGAWVCNDEASLARELSSGGALRRRVDDLRGSQSRLLLLLAVAGTPLAISQLAAMTRRPDAVVLEDLSRLEQLGFAIRSGAEYESAHDEISALVMERAGGDELIEANGAVGRVLAEHAWNDWNGLKRAGRFLAAAGQETQIDTVFKRCVLLARRQNRGVDLRALGHEFMAGESNNEAVDRMLRRLPIQTRIGVTPTRTAVAALLLLILATTSSFLLLGNSEPDAELLVLFSDGTSGTVGHKLPLHLDDWDVGEPIRFANYAKEVPGLRMRGEIQAIRAQPNGDGWGLVRNSADTGGVDIYVINGNGAERRLTYARGDDAHLDWSPDGKQIVFQTGRWNPESRYDLAVALVDTSRSVRPLLRGSSAYRYPRWSPDGSRVSYIEAAIGTLSTTPCWISVDGANRRCYDSPAPGWRATQVFWYGPGALFVVIDSSGSRAVRTVNLSSHEYSAVTDWPLVAPNAINVSANGRWIVARGFSPTRAAENFYLFPAGMPRLAREVQFPDGSPRPRLTTWTAGDSDELISRISLRAPSTSIPLTAAYHMSAVGYGPNESTNIIPFLSWHVVDTAVAVIGDRGALIPKRSGETTVVASAGGWRVDSARIAVADPIHETVFREDWGQGYSDRWRFWGFPFPQVTEGPRDIQAFWNNGDSSFSSGAYSMSDFVASDGLGIEVLISAPLNRDRWQGPVVSINPNIDTLQLARWDHHADASPPRGSHGRCVVSIGPGSEVAADLTWEDDAFQLSASERNDAGTVPFDLRSGDWHRLRLQLFSDGSCGVAIDGIPLAHVAGTGPPQGRYRVELEGRSYDTRILHGPLEIWTGVKGDIDWRDVGGKQPSPW